MKHTFDEYISSLTPAPELKDFLAEAIEESEKKIEPEKKKVADPSFAWLSVKLISLKAPTFFSNSHAAVPSMSEYVDIMCKKLYRDLNPGLLLPPYMPAPKSVAAKGKKPLASAGNSLAITTTLKKRLKKTKLSDVEETVIKVIKGGVTKLVKTTKGIKAVKEGASESNAEVDSDITTQKTEEKTNEEKPKVEKTNANGTSKPAPKATIVSEKQTIVKKTEKVPEKLGDKTFAVPSVPSKSDKHKTSKSPSPKPQRKAEDKPRKEDRKEERRLDKREEKKVDKREKRSRERSLESRKEKTNSDRLDRGKALSNKSITKRKASPKREDHKSNKVIRVSMDEREGDISREQIHDLAKSIGTNWKKVAERLGYKSDEIEYFEQDATSDYQRAANVLSVWFSDEEDATKEMLRRHLKTLGLSLAASVLSK